MWMAATERSRGSTTIDDKRQYREKRSKYIEMSIVYLQTHTVKPIIVKKSCKLEERERKTGRREGRTKSGYGLTDLYSAATIVERISHVIVQ